MSIKELCDKLRKTELHFLLSFSGFLHWWFSPPQHNVSNFIILFHFQAEFNTPYLLWNPTKQRRMNFKRNEKRKKHTQQEANLKPYLIGEAALEMPSNCKCCSFPKCEMERAVGCVCAKRKMCRWRKKTYNIQSIGSSRARIRWYDDIVRGCSQPYRTSVITASAFLILLVGTPRIV